MNATGYNIIYNRGISNTYQMLQNTEYGQNLLGHGDRGVGTDAKQSAN